MVCRSTITLDGLILTSELTYDERMTELEANLARENHKSATFRPKTLIEKLYRDGTKILRHCFGGRPQSATKVLPNNRFGGRPKVGPISGGRPKLDPKTTSATKVPPNNHFGGRPKVGPISGADPKLDPKTTVTHFLSLTSSHLCQSHHAIACCFTGYTTIPTTFSNRQFRR